MNHVAAPEDRPRILIVDDERININLLNALLKADYKIMVATDGEQALKAAMTGKPELILLDIVMPGIDGYEVCRRLKATAATQSIPIIFITAMGEVENEAMGFALGAVDYIAKPFNSPVVKARVGVHMKLKRNGDILENLASMDALTEVPNRRAFDQTRKQEWARSLRDGLPISFVMIDIDMFKQFNDNYGHGAGDECLTRIAKALNGCVQRPGDLLARYGGEEFAAILINTPEEGALRMAEVIHAAVAALQIPHAFSATAPHVSVSIGIASAIPSPSLTADILSEAADNMLYQAKNAGRNTTRSTQL
ncbi:MAG: diguanylate cyclase [Gammaproteobacteria bacterium]|jgi:diguanylate cyclase (GGDEF)-like protein|nr:diguanylate cyclase [Gammaproteobacteria bacterium]MBU1731558.1 diguanylate cyclase [Gammaproteobacteria bacterium]MBU1893718.1 diguanylate cyclase [Gammaproteobacteria bacterium]